MVVGTEGAAFNEREFLWGYGIFTALIFGAGFALVAAGRWVRARRGATASVVPVG